MNGVSKTRTVQGAALIALVVLCLGIGSANAAFPAANGLIVFASGTSIKTIASTGGSASAPIATGNNPAVSPDGTTVAYDRAGQIYTTPIGGGAETTVAGALGSEPAWSRDGSTLYYTSGPTPPDATSEIMKIASGGGAPTQLTTNAFVDKDPAVSPDGSKIAFASNSTGQFEIWVMNTDGSSPGQISGGGSPGTIKTDPTWSEDGTKVAFVSDEVGGIKNIFSTTSTPPAGGDTALTSSATAVTNPAYSPDGQLIAVTTTSGIATVPVNGGTPAAVTGTAGGDIAPDWQDAKPVNQSLPQITPATAPVVGATLSVTPGSWTGQNVNAYSYQWLRCDASGVNCINEPGASFGTTYIVQAADAVAGVTIRVQETASNIAGQNAAQSPIAGHVLAGWPINFGTPTLSAAQPHAFPNGVVVSGTTGTWTGVAPITYTFQWQWCDFANPPQCEDIPGATSSSYAPSGDYINNTLQLKITAKNSLGSDVAYTRRSYPVLGDVPVNTVSPKILAGSIEIGSTLTTDTGTFSGSTPFHFKYQWVRCVPAGTPCTRDHRRDHLDVRAPAWRPGLDDPLAGDRGKRRRQRHGSVEPHLPDPAEDALRPGQHQPADGLRQAGRRLDARRRCGLVDGRADDQVHVHVAPLRCDGCGLHGDPERHRHDLQAQGLRLRLHGQDPRDREKRARRIDGQLRPDRRDHAARAPAEGPQDHRHEEERLPRRRRRLRHDQGARRQRHDQGRRR